MTRPWLKWLARQFHQHRPVVGWFGADGELRHAGHGRPLTADEIGRNRVAFVVVCDDCHAPLSEPIS